MTRALAKAPVDRFATAADFALGLTPNWDVGESCLSARIGGEDVPVLLYDKAVAHPRYCARPPRHRNGRLACGPSSSHEPRSESACRCVVRRPRCYARILREGLVDYLSRSLDGAGTLRTVAPSRFLRN